jgi:uncharacterized protein (UPF0333 family)
VTIYSTQFTTTLSTVTESKVETLTTSAAFVVLTTTFDGKTLTITEGTVSKDNITVETTIYVTLNRTTTETLTISNSTTQ